MRDADDDITLGEVNRNLTRAMAELGQRLEKFESVTVRRDVYEADRAAMLTRVQAVEGDLTQMALGRRQMYTLIITSFILPLTVGIIILLLNAKKL